jgi:tetratricopeptide (TPR) repeat protein
MLNDLFAALNMNSKTALNDRNRFWVDEIADHAQSAADRQLKIQYLLEAACQRLGMREEAEIHANCGYWSMQDDNYAQASGSFQRAVTLYRQLEDPHREGIMRWYLFISEQWFGRYTSAFLQAKQARRNFLHQEKLFSRLQKKTQRGWYEKQIGRMTCAIIEVPQLAYECIFEFHGNRIDETAEKMRRSLQGLMEEKRHSEAFAILSQLRESTRRTVDCRESAQALAYCGVAEWLMDNKHEALRFLALALAQYIPGSHEHAVTRWMLALVQSSCSGDHTKSLINMEQCIHEFSQLKIKAVARNLDANRDWYDLHIKAMREIASERASAGALLP